LEPSRWVSRAYSKGFVKTDSTFDHCQIGGDHCYAVVDKRVAIELAKDFLGMVNEISSNALGCERLSGRGC